MYDQNYLCERYNLKFTTCEVSISDMKLRNNQRKIICVPLRNTAIILF